jgi:hypothetical protein
MTSPTRSPSGAAYHRTSAGEMRGSACVGDIGARGAGADEIGAGFLAPCRRDVSGRPAQVQEPSGRIEAWAARPAVIPAIVLSVDIL